MRCRLCHQSAGWFRRRCHTCAELWRIFEENRGAPLHTLLSRFAGTGASREHVQAFLLADPDGAGAIQDRIAADMANELFAAFGGTGGRQTAQDVGRLRRRGHWRGYGERPPE